MKCIPDLPPGVTQWLDSWGPRVSEKVLAAAEALGLKRPPFLEGSGFAACGSAALGSTALRVGTDCSDSMHLSGLCEGLMCTASTFSVANWQHRKVIEANTLPQEALFTNVLNADFEVPPWVHLYVARFSCKPFSLLRNDTKLLQEKEAEVFQAVRKRIKTLKPPAFVWENVPGIQRCLDQVKGLLQECGYQLVVEMMRPSALGEPLLRPRFYLVGAREDVAAERKKPST